MKKIVIFVLAYLVIMPKPAYAYLDPGTGSYLIQIIVGGVLGGGFLIKTYWNQLMNLFNKKKHNIQTDEIKSNE